MRIFSFLLLILLVLIGVSFATLNSQTVTINYYLGQHSLPMSLLVIIVFGIGGLIGILTTSWITLKLKIKNYRLKQRIKSAEKEIENLRAIPLQNKS
jgi:putative membrane protein